ncbi:MAG: serine hydrolase [Acidobacteriota bacterium]
MRNLVVISAFALCLSLSGCGSKEAKFSDRDRSQAITALADSVLAKRGVPGIAIAVIRDGKLFQKLTVGSSNLATGEKVSGSTPFQLASTTKIFGSTAVMLLVADGKVHLENPVGDYLDGLPSAWRSVTIRQLLSHTSGLPDITTATGEVDLVAADWESALPIIAEEPFQFRPGHGWAYTQTNYALLLRLIERVSGKTFESFLEERLFQPLGMRNTFFPGPQRRCAVNYRREQDGRITVRSNLTFPHYVHAAGGLCSSLDDLVAWSRALDSGKIMPSELALQAWSPTRLADGSNAQVSPVISYGLGWAIGTTPGHRWAGHSGGNSTAFRRYLDERMTIIMLHNGASDPDAIISSVARFMVQTTSADGAQVGLWDAAGDGNLAAAEAALQAGAKVNELDTRSSRNGRYALNWAAINNHPDIIEVLLKHGAAINAQNLTGFTALHHAAESGSAAAAQALLDAGADPSLRSASGETPSDVARRHGNTAVAQIIDKAVGKAR